MRRSTKVRMSHPVTGGKTWGFGGTLGMRNAGFYPVPRTKVSEGAMRSAFSGLRWSGDSIGGTSDIRYFRAKVFAALRLPDSYLEL